MTENYFGITDTGKMRENNEDDFIAEKILKDRYVMGCVIDGVGGYEGGEVATEIARETILHYFSIPSGDVVTMMKEALKVANEKISEEKTGVVFLLWGKYAQAKESLIDKKKHFVLKAAHPSPFSAHSGFFGCKHFSKTNEILRQRGLKEIDWRLE